MTAPHELRTERLLLRPFRSEDVPALVRHAGAKEIPATTLQIPHPYAEEDARDFLAKANDDFRAGHSVTFAISLLPGRELCGAAGLHIADAHRHAELGYWTACRTGEKDWPRKLQAPRSRLVLRRCV
jgi:[ribosomal protein S5]-alanine N-acetyltransferase